MEYNHALDDFIDFVLQASNEQLALFFGFPLNPDGSVPDGPADQVSRYMEGLDPLPEALARRATQAMSAMRALSGQSSPNLREQVELERQLRQRDFVRGLVTRGLLSATPDDAATNAAMRAFKAADGIAGRQTLTGADYDIAFEREIGKVLNSSSPYALYDYLQSIPGSIEERAMHQAQRDQAHYLSQRAQQEEAEEQARQMRIGEAMAHASMLPGPDGRLIPVQRQQPVSDDRSFADFLATLEPDMAQFVYGEQRQLRSGFEAARAEQKLEDEENMRSLQAFGETEEGRMEHAKITQQATAAGLPAASLFGVGGNPLSFSDYIQRHMPDLQGRFQAQKTEQEQRETLGKLQPVSTPSRVRTMGQRSRMGV